MAYSGHRWTPTVLVERGEAGPGKPSPRTAFRFKLFSPGRFERVGALCLWLRELSLWWESHMR